MGIRGLTTYIADNSTKCLKSYELSDCYLVVDGNCIACCLYRWKTKSYSAFGGDYDEFYKIVKDFFLLLKKCHVKPIVIFDGGHEERKLKTIRYRCQEKIPILKEYLRGFSTAVLFPLFLKKTFCEAVEDLGIFCVRTDLEADIEVAAVARALNCPVLSNDSDFYIFDVLYIPFPFLQLEPIKRDDSNNYFLKCMLYDVTNFLGAFSGLDKSVLPILATILGNDYIQPSLFNNFFGHVSVKKVKCKSFNQSKIHGVLHWLKSENAQSAIELILGHVGKTNKEKVLKAIQTSINDYTSNSVSESIFNELTTQIGDVGLSKKYFKIKLPPEIINLYRKCKINPFVVDIITLGCYFTDVQLEIMNNPSHLAASELIKYLISTLQPYSEHNNKEVKVFLILHSTYSGIKIHRDGPASTNEHSLHSLLKESRETRLKCLFKIVNIDEDELDIVSNDNSWSIFILSFIYWLKKLGSELSQTHIHALLLMAIVNEVAQKTVGYFRNISKFNKSKGNLLDKFKEAPIEVGGGNSFEEMIESVSLHEKLLIQKQLIPYRQTTKKVIENYSIVTIHYFSCFQSILYHIMEINALLNFPLPPLKVSDFYSGSLLYNFYFYISKTQPSLETFGATLFKKTPNFAKIYTYLCESLAKFFPKPNVPARKPKKKSRKKKQSLQQEKKQFIFNAVNDDSDECIDENNFYSILKNLQL